MTLYVFSIVTGTHIPSCRRFDFVTPIPITPGPFDFPYKLRFLILIDAQLKQTEIVQYLSSTVT